MSWKGKSYRLAVFHSYFLPWSYLSQLVGSTPKIQAKVAITGLQIPAVTTPFFHLTDLIT